MTNGKTRQPARRLDDQELRRVRGGAEHYLNVELEYTPISSFVAGPEREPRFRPPLGSGKGS